MDNIMKARELKKLKEKMNPWHIPIPEEKREYIPKLPLDQIRRYYGFTQKDIAEALDMKPHSISKLESKDDIPINVLRRYIEAMGGCMDIVVRIGDGAPIRVFQDWD